MRVRVGAGPLAVVLGLSAGACFLKPDRPGVVDDAGGDPRDDGSTTSDGAVPDASGPAPGCTRYDFDSGSAADCGGWGTSSTGGIGVTDGTLTLTAPATAGVVTADCTSDPPANHKAIIFDIASLPSTPDTTTHLFATIYSERYGARFNYMAVAELTPFCGTTEGIPISFAGNHLVRIRRGSAELLIIDYSSDGTTWTLASECAPSDFNVWSFGAEVVRRQAGNASTLALEYLDVCK